MKKKILLFVCPALILLVAVAAVLVLGMGSTGRCLVTENGAVLWVDDSGSPTVLSNRTGHADLFEGLGSGDRIWVLHDGIQETYPARTGVYALFRLSDGDLDDLPAQTLETLRNLGWIPIP